MIMTVTRARARGGLAALLALILLTTGGIDASAQMFGRSAPVPPGSVGAPVTDAQASAVYAEQSMRIDQMQEQMRQLNGRVEELTYLVQQLQEMLRRQQEDAEYRFQQLEGGARPQKRSDSSPATGGAPAAAGTAQLAGPPQGGLATAPDIGTPPTVLGTIPGDGTMTGPPSSSALGGPLDLSAIARGVEPAAGFGSPAIGTGNPALGGTPSAGLPGVAGGLGSPPPLSGQPQGAPGAGSFGGGTETAVLQPSDPQSAYDQAYGYILSGDYRTAEMSLKQFLADHPRSTLAGNAQFWLGESYFARDQFREAADAFLSTYRDYPKAPKAAESLLKLGLSLEGLGERDAACATYGELSKKYPSAPAALIERARAQRSKAGC